MQAIFIVCLCICIAVGDPVIKGDIVGRPLTGLTQLYLCACPKPWSGFPTSYVMVFLVFNGLM
jgi:hypothetical protein